MNIVYLQLGSNIGNRVEQLESAIYEIKAQIGDISKLSKIYESSPWRVDGQPNYLNQILEVKTEINPDMLLSMLLNIENLLGRKRVEKWGERLIDIDIIFYNNDIIETADLCIPHKHMHERKFVLVPLCEIAGDYFHPRYNKRVTDLLAECTDLDMIEEYVI